MVYVLSKTLFLIGKRCPRALWLHTHSSDFKRNSHNTFSHIPIIKDNIESDNSTLLFGTNVGTLAHLYMGKGPIINTHLKLAQKLQHTQHYIAQDCPIIYEATAQSSQNGDYASIDILKQNTHGNYNLMEVKSGSYVRENYLSDLCFQYIIFQEASIPITSCMLMTINPLYHRKSALSLRQFFQIEDVTDRILSLVTKIQSERTRIRTYKTVKEEPYVKISDHCITPYPCPYLSYCWKNIPRYSLYSLCKPHLAARLAHKHHSLDLHDYIYEKSLSKTEKIDIHAHITQKEHIEQNTLKAIHTKWTHPLSIIHGHMLNNIPIPLFTHARPYEPFLFFLLHASLSDDDTLSFHSAFFHNSHQHPYPRFVRKLCNLCQKDSTVLYFSNNNFTALLSSTIAQCGVLKDTSFINLHHLFKNRYYYHPKQYSQDTLSAIAAACHLSTDIPIPLQDLSYRYVHTMGTPDAQKLKEDCEKYSHSTIRIIALLYRFIKNITEKHSS